MARSKSTFEKMQREKAKREKRQAKREKKANKEKDDQIDVEDLTPEEFIRLHAQEEALKEENR